MAMIEFASTEGAARLLDIVADGDVTSPDTLYCRLHQQTVGGARGRRWEYTVNTIDRSLSREFNEREGTATESHSGAPCFSFAITMLIPISDLPVVLDRLVASNQPVRRSIRGLRRQGM
jgi:hypothetical protein